MSEQKIILYGAFDRYNYGDIIIPIILSKYLKANGFENIEYCSIKNADLTHLGGFKCNFLDLRQISQNTNIIITGGEVLNVDWTSISSYFMGWFGNRGIRLARIMFPRNWVNAFCIKIMKGQFKYPFLVEKSSILKPIRTIYNGVGGVSIKVSDNIIKSILLDADLVTVRDINANYILESEGKINIRLTPDIANAISKFYPKNNLLESTTQRTKAFITENKNEYFCFQMAQQYTNGKLSTIVDSLSKILAGGTSIALLPLGIISGHEDHKVMEQISLRLASKKVFILRDVHIIDSISLIAHAGVFTGTSLHGNITAMSYAVPHFPLNKHVPKLNHYIEQWDISEVEACIDYSQIHKSYEISTKMDKTLLLRNRDRLITQIEENITEICKVISLAN
jgi:polysaccharide pyruvyl transferase WcaK-like protein